MIKRNYRVLAMLLGIILLLACVPLGAPGVPPTVDLLSVNTAIAWTAQAAMTQTAFFITPTITPTITLTPTKTPAPTETSTATFIFALPTFTFTPTPIVPGKSGLNFECAIISQSPETNAVIAHSTDFDAHWKVANIGKMLWDANNVNYGYASGAKMHKTAAFDLSVSVAPGETIEFVVPMQAMDEPGTYTTTWKITSGKDQFCPMSLKIIVN